MTDANELRAGLAAIQNELDKARVEASGSTQEAIDAVMYLHKAIDSLERARVKARGSGAILREEVVPLANMHRLEDIAASAKTAELKLLEWVHHLLMITDSIANQIDRMAAKRTDTLGYAEGFIKAATEQAENRGTNL